MWLQPELQELVYDSLLLFFSLFFFFLEEGAGKRCSGCGTSHATTKERYQYTMSVDINITRHKRIQSLIQSHTRHVRSESAREQRIALYSAENSAKAMNNNNDNLDVTGTVSVVVYYKLY